MNPSPTTLAILTLDFAPETGGVQTLLFEIAARMGRTDPLTVITPVQGELVPDPQFHRAIPPAATVRGFWRTLRSIRPDRVWVGHTHPRLLMAAALYPRARYAASAYGNDFLAARRRWHWPLTRALLRRAHPLITITRANAERLHGLGLPGARVVYPGTDPQRFHPPPDRLSSPLTLLTVSRLVSRKGIDTVIQALPALLDTFSDLQYQIIGEGPDRPRLEALARSLQVQDSVRFLGRATEDELPVCYRRAHVFVMPAREIPGDASVEGFGIVYLEASASGLPVVAGRSGGAVEAVKDGETGLLVPPDDPEALAQGLHRLLSSPALRDRMGRAGRRWATEEMNWDRAARQVHALLTP